MGGYRLSDIWSILRRRFWLLLLSMATIGPLAVAIAYFLPPKFISTATIVVESQQIALVTSTVTVGTAERLQLIRQQLMTRENLLDLITKFGLYAERSDLTPSEKVEELRQNTAFSTITAPGAQRGTGAVLAFTISFTGSRAAVTASVANEFVTKILDENSRARTDRATETLSYFDQEVKRLSDALGAAEAEITRFKNENQDALPTSLGFRQGELSTVQGRLFQRQQSRLTLDEQRRTLEEALRSGQVGTLAGQPLTQEERDLLTLRNLLTQRQAVLADSHPEIANLKARIAALEKVVAPGSGTASAQASAAVQRTQAQIDLLAKQIALLDEQQERDEAYRRKLEVSIAATPQVEITLNALLRRQAQLQNEYDAAVTKRVSASQGERLEVNQQAERFVLVEPPQVPDRPTSPNRPLIAAGGVMASVVIGLGLMVLAELLNQSIRTPQMLEHRTGLRPVVTLPYIMTGRERTARRLRLALVLLVCLVAIPGALWAVDSFYLPLDVLFDRLADRTGLNGLIRVIEIRLGR